MATFFYANDNYNSNLSAGFTSGETTMSVITVPANVPTLLCFGYGTDKECVYSITDKTTNSLTGVARVSGYAGNLDAQMTVACLNNEGFINQLGSVVSSPETLADNIYGADGGGTDAYEISLDSPPSTYATGMFILFRANTANTGAASLNVNALGAKTIKKNYDSDLNDNDIIAGQVVGVVYDGTNFQMVGGNTAKATSEEVTTGTEQNKFITPKAHADAGFVLDADSTMAANSDLKIPTQKAVKAAIANKVINRAFTWYLDGTSIVANNLGAKYIVPQAMTTVTVRYKLTSGTCSFRIMKNGSEIIAPNNADSTARAWAVANAMAAGDVLSLDIWAAASPVNLAVTLECTQ